MIHFAYLGALLFSLLGMVLIDRRYSLAFFCDARATGLTLLVTLIIFVIWDLLGIGLGIFFSGQSLYMTGWYVAPELPIEELFFLTFLCYFTLILYRLGVTVWPRT